MSEFWTQAEHMAQELAQAAAAPAAGATAPVPAETIPAIPLRPGRPKGFWANTALCLSTGWKAAGCWVCVAVLLVNGIVIPLARIKYQHLEPLDWRGVTLFAATLLGLRLFHMVENITGAGQ